MNILELPCSPEDYDASSVIGLFEKHDIPSEMAALERRFVNGLLRLYRPKNILELGVSQGGGTAVILNAISEDPGAKLTSIDILTYFYNDPSLPVGWAVNKVYPGGNQQWSLHTGRFPVDIIENIGEQFDFCVIDTMHIHPVETLNFLTVLPFLSSDAIVVLHDISLFQLRGMETALAPRILFNSVVAAKLTPDNSPNDYQWRTANIGAFQIIPDTKKYIENVFLSLLQPWSTLPNENCEEFFERHYGKKFVNYYITGKELYLDKLISDFPQVYSIIDSEKFKCISDTPKLVFYGGGNSCNKLVAVFERLGLRKPVEIWDINADNISEVGGIPVVPPDFSRLTSEYGMIITIANDKIVNQISEKLAKQGFTNYIKC